MWLDNNQLTALPTELGRLKNLNKLSVSGNPLSAMPKHARQSGDAVIDYLRSLPVPVHAHARTRSAAAKLASPSRRPRLLPAAQEPPQAPPQRPAAAQEPPQAPPQRPAAAQQSAVASQLPAVTAEPQLRSSQGPASAQAVALKAELAALRDRMAAAAAAVGKVVAVQAALEKSAELQEAKSAELAGLKEQNAALRRRLEEADAEHGRHLAQVARQATRERDRAAALEAETAELKTEMNELMSRLAGAAADADAQRQRAAALEVEKGDQMKLHEQLRAEAAEQLARSERQRAELEGRLALYEGGAGPSGQQWGEAELAEAAERLKAAAGRLEALRIHRRVEEALAEERVKRRRTEGSATYECPICCEEQDPKERRNPGPCGHVVCAACTKKFGKSKKRLCFTCRRHVKTISPIYE
eukprot:tig00021518_g22020.t1